MFLVVVVVEYLFIFGEYLYCVAARIQQVCFNTKPNGVDHSPVMRVMQTVFYCVPVGVCFWQDLRGMHYSSPFGLVFRAIKKLTMMMEVSTPSEVSGDRLSILQSCSLQDPMIQFDCLGFIQILTKVRGVINRNQIRGMHIVINSPLCDLIHHCAPCFWVK